MENWAEFWDVSGKVDIIATIIGFSLYSLYLFLREWIKAKKLRKVAPYSKVQKSKVSKNLLGCAGGLLTASLFLIGMFVLYALLLNYMYSETTPVYTSNLYVMCIYPLPVALLGSLLGLAISKRYL